ncbi:MAG: hypothetical protein KGQ59_04525 [Bdellovibrionales bacterium]|nr:hypothetical protein [Bdellovibrionales bacterium]
MVKNFSKIVFAFFALTSFHAGAFAAPGFGFGLMAGPNLTFPSAPSILGSSVSGGIGFSVGPSVGVGPLEASLLYSSYTLKSTVATITTSSSSSSLDLPVLYRVGVGLIDIGFGGFYSLSLESGATSSNNNYGLVGSVRTTIPGGLFVDGRFNLGLKESASTNSKVSSLALLLGFNFI